MCGLAMNIVAMSFADKVSRPRLISLGFGLCTATLIIECALQKNYLNSSNKSGLGASAAMLFIFFVFYSLTLDGSSYFYIGELWPSHLRAQGFTLAITVLCITNVAWTEAAPYAFAAMGWKFYIFFIVFSALACVVTLLFFPNTVHKPLEEIALLFGDVDQVAVVQSDLTSSGMHFEPLEDVHGTKVTMEGMEKAN